MTGLYPQWYIGTYFKLWSYNFNINKEVDLNFTPNYIFSITLTYLHFHYSTISLRLINKTLISLATKHLLMMTLYENQKSI